ncbi:hypothetical protein BDA99DRAFT_610062 [Phascolomyces articulosus]|uniref:Uncharacterized protein n=1 Tax=Phascolomyces articulosus TaxID=60185 RepID=A0AAD5P8S1_9FUNG|nr:hypothetical protein BDA99DRAFT_610062 [Phascolomyces articulosus]
MSSDLQISNISRHGSDLRSKEMLKDEQVMNLVLKSLVGEHAINNYTSIDDGSWIDGKKMDAFFIPKRDIQTLPPVLVQIQDTVDMSFMRQITKYGIHIIDHYEMEPIVLVIGTHIIHSSIVNMISATTKAAYLKTLPSEFCAKELFIMTPDTVKDYLTNLDSNDAALLGKCNREGDSDNNINISGSASIDDNDEGVVNDNDHNSRNALNENADNINTHRSRSTPNENDDDGEGVVDNNDNTLNQDQDGANNSVPSPLSPLVALGYMLMEQKGSLSGLQRYKCNPTILLLSKIVKQYTLDHDIKIQGLVDIATQTRDQFKRILEASNENEPDLKRIRTLASDGVVFTQKCLDKYQRQHNTSNDPSSTTPSFADISATQPVAPNDMTYAAQFKEYYLKRQKRMSWKVCFETGVENGYFKSYKNASSLKSTFNEAQNKKLKKK